MAEEKKLSMRTYRQAVQAETEEQFLEIAKEAGVEVTKEQLEAFRNSREKYAGLRETVPEEGAAISDDELDNVSGGACEEETYPGSKPDYDWCWTAPTEIIGWEDTGAIVRYLYDEPQDPNNPCLSCRWWKPINGWCDSPADEC